MISKGYQRFINRLNFFRIDKEVCEIVLKNKDELAGDKKIFKGVSEKDYPLLNVRINNSSSRKLVMVHLVHTIYVAFVKELYEEVTEYIRYILKEGALNGANTDRLIGDNKVNLKANDILSKTTKKDIVGFIMDNIFQQIENERSTLELIKKIKDKLGLNIDNLFIDNALPYLLLRHIFVHADGKPDKKFIVKYKQFSLDSKRKIKLTTNILNEAYSNVNALLQKMDEEMIRLNYISETERLG